MSAKGAVATVLEEDTAAGAETASGWKTVLFNCECHSFDEVERQLLKAIGCSLSRARAISWEVHTKGSSTVYEGTRGRAEAVADILGAIGLLVKVVQ